MGGCAARLAIFLVLMNHVNMRLLSADVPYANGIPEQIVASLVWNGQRGVQIFFAVSGFLITSLGNAEGGERSCVLPNEVRAHWCCYAGTERAAFCAGDALHCPGEDGRARTRSGRSAYFPVNVLEARRSFLPGSWDILWSLSVEEMFSLFFPLTSRLLSRGKLLIALLAGFVVMGPLAKAWLAHGNEVWREYSYLGGMDAIALGCLTALVLEKRRLSHAALRLLMILGTAMLAFSLEFSLKAQARGLSRSGLDMTILVFGTCMLIALGAQTRWKSPRGLGPLLSLGTRNYEIYQSSAKSLGIDAGDGLRDDVNAGCLQDVSKIEHSKIEYCSQSRVELDLRDVANRKRRKAGSSSSAGLSV
jgi:peptidoglycan/LPS O-acetylase OafA/YrhL